MGISMKNFEMPKKLALDESTATPTYGKFIAEPFERGYGATIGNSIRRVLISSIEGTSVTSVKIHGIQHEFSTVKGVLEDVPQIIMVCFVVVGIAGCASAPKKAEEELKTVKTKVDTLETRVEGVETKQADMERAAAEQAQALAAKATVETNITTRTGTCKGSERIKEIQTCLKNAGFYDGNVDGVKGKQTKKAVKDFQKANGITADGVVGKKTWELLSKYSQGSIK
jgi:DNA-directed RNA polymerase alpha subunit